MKIELMKTRWLVPLLLVSFLSVFTSSPDLQSGEYIGQIQSRYRNGLSVEALRIAHTQVGVTEVGKNHGEVSKYQKVAGIPIGSPYCYAGIYWCFDSAAKKLKVNNYLLRTGLASSGRKHLQKISAQCRALTLPALLFYQFTKSPFGHVEFVFEYHKGNWVRCVGFNTGNNARDGGGVKYTYRNIRHPLSKMFVHSIICLS